MDSAPPEKGPSHYANEYIFIYFVIFIILAAFFFINILIGTLMYFFDITERYIKITIISLILFKY
jgi:hypothetical protein